MSTVLEDPPPALEWATPCRGPKTPVWDPPAIWCPWASSLLPAGSGEGLDMIRLLINRPPGTYYVPNSGEDQTGPEECEAWWGKLDRWTDDSRTGE